MKQSETLGINVRIHTFALLHPKNRSYNFKTGKTTSATKKQAFFFSKFFFPRSRAHTSSLGSYRRDISNKLNRKQPEMHTSVPQSPDASFPVRNTKIATEFSPQ
jgi:hypothetical protein